MIDYGDCPSWLRSRLEEDIFPRLPKGFVRALHESNLSIRYLINEDSRFAQYHKDAHGLPRETLGVYLARGHMLILGSFDEITIVHELIHALDHLLSDTPGEFWSATQADVIALYEKHAGKDGDGRVVGDSYAMQSVQEYLAESGAAALGFDARQQRRLQRICPDTHRTVHDIMHAVDTGWLVPRKDHAATRCQSAGTNTTHSDPTASHNTTQTKDDDAQHSAPLQEAETSGT